MFYDITQAEVEALLCRPLSSCETSSLALYIENSKAILESYLCTDFLSSDECTTRYYDYIDSNNIYTDVFYELCSIKIEDCDTLEDFDVDCSVRPRFGGNYNSKIFNNIEICEKDSCGCPINTCLCESRCKRWVVEAKFGYGDDEVLKNILLELVKEAILNGDCNQNVKSKSIEGYQVTFKSDNEKISVIDKYNKVLEKYRNCSNITIFGV